MSETWQPVFEHYLLKARRCSEDARTSLARLGAAERKDGNVQQLLTALKEVESAISSLWEINYGPRKGKA